MVRAEQVVFPPSGNPNVFGIAEAQVLDNDACDRVLGTVDPDAWTSGLVGQRRDETTAAVVHSATRRVLVQPLAIADDLWPIPTIVSAVTAGNNQMFHFDIQGFSAGDPPLVARYRADDSGGYSPHIDLCSTQPTRKLTFSILLSDPDSFVGGDLQLPYDNQKAARTRGVMALFPSFMGHEVTPITKGERVALVGWVHGPTFR